MTLGPENTCDYHVRYIVFHDLNRSRQPFVDLSVGEKWQPKHDAMLVIRVKQDEQLFSKLGKQL